MLTLLVAAISKKNKGVCRGVVVAIKGVQNNFFIDEKDINSMLVKAAGGNIKGRGVASLNLHELETVLENNTWIDEAEMYFDNKDILHVKVTEKEPVARIFTIGSTSFYIDSAGIRMPLSDKLSARVPVFTGFTDRSKWTKADSQQIKQVKNVAVYIFNNPFWMSQVAQVDITPDGNFEMVPVVGNHLVKLGNGENIEKKFNRLMIFYKQVMSKTGFDKYKLVDVQYNGQVIASRNSGTGKIDSVQLRRNIEKLIQQSATMQSDSVAPVRQITNSEAASIDAANASQQDITLANPEHQNPNPMKLSVPKKPAATAADKKPVKKDGEKPRAVMPKRTAPAPVNEDRGYN